MNPIVAIIIILYVGAGAFLCGAAYGGYKCAKKAERKGK
jgi:hypothetical protein